MNLTPDQTKFLLTVYYWIQETHDGISIDKLSEAVGTTKDQSLKIINEIGQLGLLVWAADYNYIDLSEAGEFAAKQAEAKTIADTYLIVLGKMYNHVDGKLDLPIDMTFLGIWPGHLAAFVTYFSKTRMIEVLGQNPYLVLLKRKAVRALGKMPLNTVKDESKVTNQIVVHGDVYGVIQQGRDGLVQTGEMPKRHDSIQRMKGLRTEFEAKLTEGTYREYGKKNRPILALTILPSRPVNLILNFRRISLFGMVINCVRCGRIIQNRAETCTRFSFWTLSKVVHKSNQ